MSYQEIGFVLVTHENAEQIAFLCRRLSTLFDDPPIALHHDFSQCPLDLGQLPSNVYTIKDWAPTAWGKFSIVSAYLKALRLLHKTATPQWTVSLSGADYPIKSATYILNDLRNSAVDAFMDYREITGKVQSPSDANSVANFGTAAWMKSAQELYVSFDVLPYRIRKHIGLKNRTLYVRNSLTTRWLTPFNATFRPFGGDAWHTMNLRAAQIMLAEDDRSRTLARFYRRRAIPDESYYQTVLLNQPQLQVEKRNLRYTIWSPGARSPRLLTQADIPDMLASKAHFARKFAMDAQTYRLVDDAIEAAGC